MKNFVLATAVAAALSLAGQEAGAQSRAAASRSDLEAVQAQMQALTERLNRLEAANTELKAENAELKTLVDRRDAETDYLKAQTKELREESAVASNEISKVKGADWATKIKARGDFRYRHEEIHRERTVRIGRWDHDRRGCGGSLPASHPRTVRHRRPGKRSPEDDVSAGHWRRQRPAILEPEPRR